MLSLYIQQRRYLYLFQLLCAIAFAYFCCCSMVAAQLQQNVLYVDTSLIADNTMRNCSMQWDPCSSISEAMSNAQPNMLNIVRFTSLRAQAILRQAQVSRLFSTQLEWFRPSPSTIADVDERETYLYTGATVVVRMPWQCTADSQGVVQPPFSGVGVSSLQFEPDTLLQQLAFPNTTEQGNITQIEGVDSSSMAKEVVMVELMYDRSLCASLPPATAFQVHNATFRLIGFNNFFSPGSLIITITIQPIADQQGGSTTIQIDQCAFLRGGAQLSTPSTNQFPFPSLFVNQSAIYSCNSAIRFFGTSQDTTGTIISVQGLRLSAMTTVWSAADPIYARNVPVPLSLSNVTFRNSHCGTCLNFQSSGPVSLDGLIMQNVTVFGSAGTAAGLFLLSLPSGVSGQGSAITSDSVISLTISSSTVEDNFNSLLPLDALSTSGGGALGISATRIPGDVLAKTTLTDVKFYRNTAVGSGGAVFATGVVMQYFSCSFKSNRALQGNGGAVFMASQQYTSMLQDVIFSNNSAVQGSGGCVFLSSMPTTSMQQVAFDRCSAGTEGGALYLQQSGVTTTGITVQNCTAVQAGGAVMLQNSYGIVQDSTIQDTSSLRGGVVALDGSASGFVLSKSGISNSMAKYGAAIAMRSLGYLVLETATIANVQALVGGVVYFDGISSSVANANFVKLPHRFSYTLSSLSSTYVPSQRRSYLLKGLSIQKAIATDSSHLFACLEAAFCPNWVQANSTGLISISALGQPLQTVSSLWSSSDPRSMVITSIGFDSFGPYNASVVPFPATGSSAAPLRLYPGQTFSIISEFYDFYGNKVTQYSDVQLRLVASTAAQPGPLLQPSFSARSPSRDLLQGSILFEGLSITGEPGQALTLLLSFVVPSSGVTIRKELPVVLRSCALGFVLAQGSCSRCNGPLMYSTTTGATQCSICPTNAFCDSNTILALDGYYLVNSNSSSSNASQALIMRCPNSYCRSGNQCVENRGGLLCGTCKEGYSNWNGQCMKCGPGESNGGLIFGWLVLLFAQVLFQHVSSQSPKSGAVKILYFFTQIFLLVVGPLSSSLLGWAKSIFSFDLALGGATDVTCPFERSSTGRMLTELFQPVAFVVIILALIMPSQMIRIVILLVSRLHKRSRPAASSTIKKDAQVALSPGEPGQENDLKMSETSAPSSVVPIDLEMQEAGTADSKPQAQELRQRGSSAMVKIRKLSKKVKKVDRNAVEAKLRKKLFKLCFGLSTWCRSLLNMLVLSFTVLCSASFQWFNCRSVGSDRVLINATDVSCSSKEYGQLTWLFVLGCIYVCLLPVLFFLVLVTLRVFNLLHHKDVKRFIGTLYTNYKPWCQFWYEPYALSRRLIIVILVVFLGDAQDVLWPLLLAVLLLFLLIQLTCRPYLSWSENIAEEFALSSLVLIVAVNISIVSSPTAPSIAAQTATSAVSLIVFIATLIVIAISFVSNHWLTVLLVDFLGIRARFVKLREQVSTFLSGIHSPHSQYFE